MNFNITRLEPKFKKSVELVANQLSISSRTFSISTTQYTFYLKNGLNIDTHKERLFI